MKIHIFEFPEPVIWLEKRFELSGSFYAYIVLHMLLYAANIYFWRRYKINYAFIFGFKQGTELSYREVFLLSNGLAMLVFAALLMHLHMNSRAEEYVTRIEYVPLGLMTVRF